MYCLQWNEFQLRGEITFNGTVVSLALHKGNKTLLVAAIKDSQCLRLHVTDLLIGPTNSGMYFVTKFGKLGSVLKQNLLN